MVMVGGEERTDEEQEEEEEQEQEEQEEGVVVGCTMGFKNCSSAFFAEVNPSSIALFSIIPASLELL